MGLQHFEVLPPVFSPVGTKSGIVWKRCRKNSSEKDVKQTVYVNISQNIHDSTKSSKALLKWSSAGAAFVVEVKCRMNLVENVWTCAPKRPSLLLFTGNYPSLSLPRFRLYESPEPSQLRCDSVPTPKMSCDRSHGEVLIPIQGAQLSNWCQHCASIDPMGPGEGPPNRFGNRASYKLHRISVQVPKKDPS